MGSRKNSKTLDILRNETFDYAQKKAYEAPVKRKS
jgi:hypothetical protein